MLCEQRSLVTTCPRNTAGFESDTACRKETSVKQAIQITNRQSSQGFMIPRKAVFCLNDLE